MKRPSLSILVCGGFLLAIVASSLLAPLIVPHDPNHVDLSLTLKLPNSHYLLGTDQAGRDVLSRVLTGSLSTLLSACAVVLFSLGVGLPLGMLCGYVGGWVDGLIMRLWDVLLAFPTLLLAFVFVAGLGRGSASAILALGIIYVPMISRLSRSLTRGEISRTYVEAARSFGYSHARILFLHILPNCRRTILSEVTLDLGYAMLDLAALSFLGLGVQPPQADWGAMLDEGRAFLLINPWISLAPGLLIIVTVVTLNLLSDAFLQEGAAKTSAKRWLFHGTPT